MPTENNDLDPIVIAPYNAHWPRRFAQLAHPLRKALGDVALRIDHIGSTAVPSLKARPIIDIQISVVDFEPLDAFRLPLEGLGYVFYPENPDLLQRYFREAPGKSRRAYTYLRPARW